MTTTGYLKEDLKAGFFMLAIFKETMSAIQKYDNLGKLIYEKTPIC
jgi:hypothetical protein